eukprot:9421401-Heterocapsa_arctica.AAC.1
MMVIARALPNGPVPPKTPKTHFDNKNSKTVPAQGTAAPRARARAGVQTAPAPRPRRRRASTFIR